MNEKVKKLKKELNNLIEKNPKLKNQQIALEKELSKINKLDDKISLIMEMIIENMTKIKNESQKLKDTIKKEEV